MGTGEYESAEEACTHDFPPLPYFRRHVAYYVHISNNVKFLKLKKKCSFGLMGPKVKKNGLYLFRQKLSGLLF